MNQKLAAFLSERQGLNAFSDQSSAQVLAANGWARTVGGANPYLTLFTRNKASRESLERDTVDCAVHEFASARGCTYLLPAEHFQIGIKCSQGFNADSAIRTAKSKLGVTDSDIEALKAGIVDALKDGPLDAAGLKEPLGGLFRHFGDIGKKVGQTTNVSLGLLALQSEAKIRRIPIDGRLDGQSYRYCLFENPPIVDDSFPRQEAFRALAELYWCWCGFASLSHFQWFSGLSGKAAQEATEHLALIPLGDTSLLGTQESHDLYSEFKPSTDSAPRLVSGLDSLFLLRRDLSLHLCETQSNIEVLSGGKFNHLGSLADLSTHAIVDRGQIVGLWEYDAFSKEVVSVSFSSKSEALAAEIERTQNFVRDELGDARSFSLDSPKSRMASIASLRVLAEKT